MPQYDYTPRSWEQKNAERLQNALNIHQIVRDRGDFRVQPDPAYDWAKKAEQMAYQTAQMRAQAAQQRAQNRNVGLANSSVTFNGGGGVNVGRAKGDFGRLLQAIAGKESGGNYGAVNSDSGALGKYQIMPANIPSWSQAALGHSISTQQFLSSPRLQEAIARHRLRQYYNQHGAAGAASAWYSGDPNKWKTGAGHGSQGAYPTIYNYVMAILRAMGKR